MSHTDKYSALKEQMKTTREQMKTAAKNAFSEMAKSLFEEQPTLKSFSWTQYTPYFNDGDVCEFSAHTGGVDLRMESDPDGDSFDYDFEYSGYDKEGSPERLKAGRAVLKFLQVFEDEDFKDMFGDHISVMVTKKGVSTENYEHD